MDMNLRAGLSRARPGDLDPLAGERVGEVGPMQNQRSPPLPLPRPSERSTSVLRSERCRATAQPEEHPSTSQESEGECHEHPSSIRLREARAPRGRRSVPVGSLPPGQPPSASWTPWPEGPSRRPSAVRPSRRSIRSTGTAATGLITGAGAAAQAVGRSIVAVAVRSIPTRRRLRSTSRLATGWSRGCDLLHHDRLGDAAEFGVSGRGIEAPRLGR